MFDGLQKRDAKLLRERLPDGQIGGGQCELDASAGDVYVALAADHVLSRTILWLIAEQIARRRKDRHLWHVNFAAAEKETLIYI